MHADEVCLLRMDLYRILQHSCARAKLCRSLLCVGCLDA